MAEIRNRKEIDFDIMKIVLKHNTQLGMAVLGQLLLKQYRNHSFGIELSYDVKQNKENLQSSVCWRDVA